MARTMKAGDTYPPLRGEASDANGILDLSGATSLEVVCTGPSHMITGAARALQPPITDEEGMWNWEYDFVEGDTANAGTYTVELKVTWPGGLQTFPNTGSEELIIEAT